MYTNNNAINFDFLESLPTIYKGHTSDIKSEGKYIRISLTRTGYEDIRQAFIEIYNGATWVTVIEITQMKNDGKWIDCPADVL